VPVAVTDASERRGYLPFGRPGKNAPLATARAARGIPKASVRPNVRPNQPQRSEIEGDTL